MSFDYGNSRLKAESIIAKFGAAGSVVKVGVTGGLDAWGNVIADIPDVTIAGLISPRMAAKIAEVDNTNVLSTDGFVFFHSDDAPEIGMQTTLNGVTYRIENIKKLDSVGGVNVYRKLQIRA